jgi:hypothetical protein
MHNASDAMVTVHDLNQAVEEKCRGYSEGTMARLIKTEPYLALYVEGLAAHFSNRPQPREYDLNATADALDRLLVIVRAIEIGQHRLWRGSIPPSSPLGRMITGDQQGDRGGPK